MRTLLVHDYGEEAAKLEGQRAAPNHADTLIDSHRTRVVTLSGETIAFYLPNRIDDTLWMPAYRDWWNVKGLPKNRATAGGFPSLPEIRKDGRLSAYHSVPPSVLARWKRRGVGTGWLGYVGGHRTPLTKQYPEWLGHAELFQRVNQLYKKYVPALYSIQRAVAKKIRHISGTAFTTVYLARKFRTAYHRDSGNLPGVMSCLIPMGDFEGGELVLPRWRIAFALRPSDVLLFIPQELHGNLPITGERLSAACYCCE